MSLGTISEGLQRHVRGKEGFSLRFMYLFDEGEHHATS